MTSSVTGQTPGSSCSCRALVSGVTVVVSVALIALSIYSLVRAPKLLGHSTVPKVILPSVVVTATAILCLSRTKRKVVEPSAPIGADDKGKNQNFESRYARWQVGDRPTSPTYGPQKAFQSHDWLMVPNLINKKFSCFTNPFANTFYVLRWNNGVQVNTQYDPVRKINLPLVENPRWTFYPLHIGRAPRSHYVAIVIDHTNHKLFYYDSLGDDWGDEVLSFTDQPISQVVEELKVRHRIQSVWRNSCRHQEDGISCIPMTWIWTKRLIEEGMAAEDIHLSSRYTEAYLQEMTLDLIDTDPTTIPNRPYIGH